MHHSPKTQSEPCKVEDSEAQKPLLKQWNANWLGHQNHILLYNGTCTGPSHSLPMQLALSYLSLQVL